MSACESSVVVAREDVVTGMPVGVYRTVGLGLKTS
jgi:hypothetical protein